MEDHLTMPKPRPQRNASAFTLTEVLIALGIFALGSVAVASIFPSAILLQKRTIQDVEAETFEAAIRAQLLGRGFLDAPLLAAAGGVPDRLVTPKTAAVQTPVGGRWPLRTRSYGSLSQDAVDREMFWKPLFFDANPRGSSASAADERAWSVFVFIVRPAAVGTYPKGGFAAGDLALQNPADPESVPGVGRLAWKTEMTNATRGSVAAAKLPERFFLTGGTGSNANTRVGIRIIRPGDKVLLGNGEILRVIGADADSVEVAGPIFGFADNQTVDVWYADPGTARETAFVELFELRDADGSTDYLVH